MISDAMLEEIGRAEIREPTDDSIGIYVCNAIAILAFTETFFWFNSRAELLRFVRELAPEYAGLGYDETREFARETSDFEDASTDLKRLLEFTQVLELKRFYIEWIGTLEELCTDYGPYPLIARHTFRGNDDDAPIDIVSHPAFAEHVGRWQNWITNTSKSFRIWGALGREAT